MKLYLEEAYDAAKSTILKHKKTMERIAELLIKKEYISGEDFSMMVENPDKIEEFKNADEIVTKAEEKSEVGKVIEKVEEKMNEEWEKRTEPKKVIKKDTSRKKS